MITIGLLLRFMTSSFCVFKPCSLYKRSDKDLFHEMLRENLHPS